MNTSRHVALAIIVAGLAPLVTTVSANAEIVRVEFAGTMDFSSIGGNALQPYSGVFAYDTAVPPFESGVINGIAYAHYQLTLVGFEMFGRPLSPALVSILDTEIHRRQCRCVSRNDVLEYCLPTQSRHRPGIHEDE